jgi:hypothetical protein
MVGRPQTTPDLCTARAEILPALQANTWPTRKLRVRVGDAAVSGIRCVRP